MTDQTRRDFFKVASATAATAAIPTLASAAQPQEVSPVRVLYLRWKDLRNRAADKTISDDDIDLLADEMGDIEAEMLALPSESMADLAIKVTVNTSAFDFAVSGKSADWLKREILMLAEWGEAPQ